jgi:hypothetical protein
LAKFRAKIIRTPRYVRAGVEVHRKKSGAEYGQNRVESLSARSIPMSDTCKKADSDRLDDSYRP